MNDREATVAKAKAVILRAERPEWEDILKLLAMGEYEPAASLLVDKEGATDSVGDPALTTMLEATRQMCLAANDVQAEIVHYQRAFSAATERERQLRQHLQALLSLIALRMTMSDQTVTVTAPLLPAIELGEAKRDLPKLLKRLQNLLGSRGEATPDAKKGGRTPSAAPSIELPGRAAHDGPSLAIYCLGPFSVYQNDRLIDDWNGLKGLMILKYLVAQGGKPVAKDVLMEVLWPSGDPEAARRNLHQAIYSLRQTLRQEDPAFQHISFHNDAYQFNPNMNVWIDFVEFERYLQFGQQQEMAGRIEEAMGAYAVAEELYEGDFFEEDPYEEWAVGQRERLRNSYLTIVDQLAAYHVQRREYTTAAAVSQKALTHDPYFEAAHRRLMQCYFAQGQRHLAVRQYQTCVRLLAEELDLQPSMETTALYRQVKDSD